MQGWQIEQMGVVLHMEDIQCEVTKNENVRTCYHSSCFNGDSTLAWVTICAVVRSVPGTMYAQMEQKKI